MATVGFHDNGVDFQIFSFLAITLPLIVVFSQMITNFEGLDEFNCKNIFYAIIVNDVIIMTSSSRKTHHFIDRDAISYLSSRERYVSLEITMLYYSVGRALYYETSFTKIEREKGRATFPL